MFRHRSIVILVLLAACSPPQRQTATNAPAQSVAPNAVLSGVTPLEGEWFLNAPDLGLVSAAFGVPESEGEFAVQCDLAAHRVTLFYSWELTPDQDTTLRVLAQGQAVEFAAHSYNEGLPTVNAEVPGSDPRLAALAATQEHFGVAVGEDVTSMPWDQKIAQVLSRCAE